LPTTPIPPPPDSLPLPIYSHHDFRHFFVSNAIEEGIDFKTIAAWVGHQDGGLLVARTYGHLRPIHSENMAQRMTFTAAGQHGQVERGVVQKSLILLVRPLGFEPRTR